MPPLPVSTQILSPLWEAPAEPAPTRPIDVPQARHLRPAVAQESLLTRALRATGAPTWRPPGQGMGSRSSDLGDLPLVPVASASQTRDARGDASLLQARALDAGGVPVPLPVPNHLILNDCQLAQLQREGGALARRLQCMTVRSAPSLPPACSPAAAHAAATTLRWSGQPDLRCAGPSLDLGAQLRDLLALDIAGAEAVPHLQFSAGNGGARELVQLKALVMRPDQLAMLVGQGAQLLERLRCISLVLGPKDPPCLPSRMAQDLDLPALRLLQLQLQAVHPANLDETTLRPLLAAIPGLNLLVLAHPDVRQDACMHGQDLGLSDDDRVKIQARSTALPLGALLPELQRLEADGASARRRWRGAGRWAATPTKRRGR